MNSPRRVDVLVIGLGPAGASAALAAAEAGLEVLAVERRAVIGLPVQCAEYIPLTIAHHAQREGIRRQAVASMKSWLQHSEPVHTQVPGLMIDRGRFDQSLAAAAQQAGAELWTATRLLALSSQRNEASLSDGNRQQAVAYDYLVAADGPRSRVARELGLAALETIYSYQISVPLLQAMQETEVWHDARFPGGYAWLFPRGEEANLGVAGFATEAGRLKTGLQALHGQLMAAGRLGARVLRCTGGAIPVGGVREPLVVGRHLFVGDAAGLCHPITGAGIATAVDSGFAAGEAIAAHRLSGEQEALLEYGGEITERYGASLAHAADRRRWLWAQWRAGRYQGRDTPRRGWIACDEYFDKGNYVGGR